MIRKFPIFIFILFLTACDNGTPILTKSNNDTTSKNTADLITKTSANQIPKTHLQDTTIVEGNFILFLRPDSLRFDSFTKDQQSGIYETDSDFGFGIDGTWDSISKNKKYIDIKALVTTNRYIIIKDCKTCPLTIDRDTINYGIILSGKRRQIRATYNYVHSGNYLQEIDEYFNIK